MTPPTKAMIKQPSKRISADKAFHLEKLERNNYPRELEAQRKGGKK